MSREHARLRERRVHARTDVGEFLPGLRQAARALILGVPSGGRYPRRPGFGWSPRAENRKPRSHPEGERRAARTTASTCHTGLGPGINRDTHEQGPEPFTYTETMV